MASLRTEANDDDAERPSIATQYATHVLPADLQSIVNACDDLPQAIRTAMIALVSASEKRDGGR